MIIIGIDPGTASTGYGIVKKQMAKGKKGKCFKCLNWGAIKTEPKFSQPERLKTLNNELSKLIKKYQPRVMAVESLYFFKNLKTAVPVSRAAGVIFLTAAKKKIPIREFSPLQIKLTVAGDGRAEKESVQKKVKKLLKIKKIPKSDDAADALAVALTYFLKEDSLRPRGLDSRL